MKNKLLTKLLLLPVLLLMGSSAYAQISVSGNVADQNGPVPGVNIVVQGTSNGAQSDFDGNYTIDNVAEDATLVFSYIGYATQEVSVNGRTSISIVLNEDAEALGEVVVIGYGTTTVKDATGAVSSVTSKDFNQGVISSPEQLIQGKTAGVQITEASGEPGSGIAFRIRGTNSIRSNNNPLFVVDGVPLSGGAAPAPGDLAFGGGAERNPLSFINPSDIESISVLKDASATAIYGSRGANGVVIIQTKSGRGSSEGVWELNSSISSATAASRYDLLNRDQYLTALEDFGNDPQALDFGFRNDFQDFYTRTSTSTRNDVSYSQSYTGGNIRASFGYSKQFGVVKKSDQERIVGRLNAQQRFFDNKLKLSFQGSASRVNDQAAPISGAAGSTGDFIGSAITANPTWPLDENFNPGSNLLNPVNILRYYQSNSNNNRFLLNLSASYDITSELTAKVTGGYDYADAETLAVFAPEVNGLNQVSGIGRGAFNTIENENKLFEATVNYKKDFGSVELDLLAGYSYQKFDRTGFNSLANDLRPGESLASLGDDIRDTYRRVRNLVQGDFQQFAYDENRGFIARLIPGAAEPTVVENLDVLGNRRVGAFFANHFDNFDELQSYFFRANANIAGKYLLTATIRADGSSTFGPDNQYGYFPSGAFAWQLSEEDFIGDAFSTLKLRVGAGVVGSQEGLGYANFLQRIRFNDLGFNGDGTVFDPGTGPVGSDNPVLQWEETLDLNFGIDFGFNDDKITGSINVYSKETSDLLLNRTLAAPQPSNQTTIFSNLTDGTVINQGIELQLDVDVVETDDFSFNTSFNIAYNQNEVQDTDQIIDLAPINGNGLTGAFAQRLEAGQPLNSFYVAEFTGFDADGFPTYLDVNGDGVGDPDSDKKFIGKDAVPDVTAGLSLNFRYKNFDFATFFTGQFAFHVYNATDNAFFTAGGITIAKNVTQAAITSGEDGAATTAVSSRFVEAGDFVRLQNASVGYNFPLKDENSFFDSLRLSVTGQNLFIITDYSGLDPEASSNTGTVNSSAIPAAGIDYASYPRPRTITLGLNAKF